MSEALFARLRMAYMRGAAWRDENGSLDLVEKASYDYADKETSPLTENYREPGEFGEGATVRRAEPAVAYRTCGTAELVAANPNVMSCVTEREAEIERLRAEIAQMKADHACEIADMATRFRAVNVEWLSESLGADVFAMREKMDALEATLRKIADYDDAAANAYLRATGEYSAFDEPGAVEMARGVLEGKTDG